MRDETRGASVSASQGPKVRFERERGVYSISLTRDVAHMVVSIIGEGTRSERIMQVFHTLANAQVPIFLVKLHRTAVSFALVAADLTRAESVMKMAGMSMRTRSDLAIVAVIAASMRAVSGVMVDISDALSAAGAHLYGTGDSHDSVLCLIEEERADAAVQQLCLVFHLDRKVVRERNLTEAAR